MALVGAANCNFVGGGVLGGPGTLAHTGCAGGGDLFAVGTGGGLLGGGGMWSTKVVLDDAALLEEALLDGADLLDEALLTRAALLEDRIREPSAIAVLSA